MVSYRKRISGGAIKIYNDFLMDTHSFQNFQLC